MPRMRAVVIAAIALALIPAGQTLASSPPTSWNGVNPFRCTLQQAGFGTAVADPGADPFCIEFDKTHQNVTQLGVVDFLTQEPARVALAVPKCFYFQSDHWRGSIVQSDGSTKTYEWDGHYFFDKARGEGGAWVTNFNINGHTSDPGMLPGLPPDFARDSGPGTGGVRTMNDVPGDPGCAARAAANPNAIYAAPPPPLSPVSASLPPGLCDSNSTVGPTHLGPVVFGESARDLRIDLGDPDGARNNFESFCGARLLVERKSALLDVPTGVLATADPRYRVHGIGAGASARAFRRILRAARLRAKLGRTLVYQVRPRSGLLIAVRRRRVVLVAVANRTTAARAPSLRRALRGAL
ncbi:MAG TPA: hypothetical protein VHE14_01065 [Solirubrobacteraceae bacterium]|nr:hypothetical protein [Solirubrobacteraceae bacterium]